ncbi:hypothetical protein PsorP6_011154 [Peronosclerospora sorghi]|uniref:Uncharacterized protein n=1 Tax=Peronosclerospora sorghi TaxID=230839 RepID=A0ACC0VWY1_9STRA|nr:hypothetical protein PsorP6_011154 [Peronosclerospora sorghi]
MEGNQILVVGVCGGSGSGKTTLKRAIMAEFGADLVSYLSHDYYKDLSHLTMDSVRNTTLIIQTRLNQILCIILVEGILIFSDQALTDLMDIKIFVETAADIRLVRRMRRDMEERGRTAESVMEQYMKTVRPMHIMFVEQSKRVADIIIPQGVNSVAPCVAPGPQ